MCVVYCTVVCLSLLSRALIVNKSFKEVIIGFHFNVESTVMLVEISELEVESQSAK